MSAVWVAVCLASASGTFTLLPESVRDTEERIIVRFGVGVTPSFGTADPGPGSDLALGAEQLRAGNTLLDANLAVGTRRTLLRTLNTYALIQGVMDLRGAPAVLATGNELPVDTVGLHPSITHAYGSARAVLFHLAYAELDGFTERGLASQFSLRAGRQFHWGMTPVTFDGGTLGFEHAGFRAEILGGQRSAVYQQPLLPLDSTPGFLVGGNAAYTFGLFGAGARIKAEYIHFQRRLGLIPREQAVYGQQTVDLSADLAQVSFGLQPSRDIDVRLRAQFALPELTRIEASALWAFGRNLLRLEFQQRVGRDLIFGLATGRGLSRQSRETSYETLRLNIPNRKPFSDLKASFTVELDKQWDIVPFVGGRKVFGAAAERTAYDADRLLFGSTTQFRGRLSQTEGIEVTGEYTGILYGRSYDDQQGVFDDVGVGAEKWVNDVYASVRYVRGDRASGGRLLTGQWFSAGVYGYLMTAVLDSRYLRTERTEVSGGGGIDARLTLGHFGVRGSYEFVRDSNILFSELGGFHVLRTQLEASF